MKISKQRYNLMLNSMRAMADHVGPDEYRNYAESSNDKRMMWLLHRHATDQLQYDDTHPNFVNGTWERVVPHEPSYKMYEDNGTPIHDSHIETALKKIGRELGLVVGEWK